MNKLQDHTFIVLFQYILILKMHVKVRISNKFLIEQVKVKLCPLIYKRTYVPWWLRHWHFFHEIMGSNLCKCIHRYKHTYVYMCVYLYNMYKWIIILKIWMTFVYGDGQHNAMIVGCHVVRFFEIKKIGTKLLEMF